MALKHSVTATGTNDAGKQVSVNAWNADHVIDETQPSAPSSGLSLFAENVANYRAMTVVGPSGAPMPLAGHLGLGRRVLMVRYGAGVSSAAATASGAFIGLPAAPVTSGTNTQRVASTTSAATRCGRLGLVSSATAGTVIYWVLGTAAGFFLGDGNSPGLGGFMHVWRFVPSDAATVSGARMFLGMSSSVATPTNVEPNTLTNSIGIAQLSTSNNLQIVYGGSAAQTAIDLGANFPANTLSADLYDFVLYAPPNLNNTVYYYVARYTSSSMPAFIATGTLTGTAGSALPSSSTGLTPRAWRTNNATALAVGLDLSVLYVEDASL